MARGKNAGRKPKPPDAAQGVLSECNKNVIFKEPSAGRSTEGVSYSSQNYTERLPGVPMGSPSKPAGPESYTQGEISARRKGVHYPKPPKDPPLSAKNTPPCHGGVSSGNETPDDSTKSAKFLKIKEKKVQNKKLVEYAGKTVTNRALDIDVEGGEVAPFKPMTEKTLERIADCSTWMELATPEDYSKFKKIGGFTCKNAFCPICAAYQSRRDGLKLSAMMDWMQALKDLDVAKHFGDEVAADKNVKKAMEHGVEFVMLTLTTPNVNGVMLKDEEKKYSKAFNRMFDDWVTRKFPEVIGYARKLEVTYNKQKLITKEMWEGTGKYNSPWKWRFRHMGLKVGDRNPYYNTYNPHYHVILAVTPEFFTIADDGTRRMKITREMWLEKWRQLMKDPSITQVKVQEVYKARGEGNQATAELAKYVAKDTDMLYSPKVFRVFYESLKNVKRMTFGGIFAVAHKLFKDGKLDRFMPGDDTPYKWVIQYAWAGTLYNEKERRVLSPEEADMIRGMKYSEANDTEDF